MVIEFLPSDECPRRPCSALPSSSLRCLSRIISACGQEVDVADVHSLWVLCLCLWQDLCPADLSPVLEVRNQHYLLGVAG